VQSTIADVRCKNLESDC